MRLLVVLFFSTMAWADASHFTGPIDSVNGFSVAGVACVDKTGHLVGTCASGGGTPGGTAGQAQYNNTGAFGGALLTYDATAGQEHFVFPTYGASPTAAQASAGGGFSGLLVASDGLLESLDGFARIHSMFGGTLASPTAWGGTYEEDWDVYNGSSMVIGQGTPVFKLFVFPTDTAGGGAYILEASSVNTTVSIGQMSTSKKDVYAFGRTNSEVQHNHEMLLGYNADNTQVAADGTNPYVGIGVSAKPEIEVKAGKVTLTALSGSGNAYACIDANGFVFRSAVTCASATTSTTTTTTSTTTTT